LMGSDLGGYLSPGGLGHASLASTMAGAGPGVSRLHTAEATRTTLQTPLSLARPPTVLPNLAREYHNRVGQEWYERSTSLSQHAQKQFQESNRVRQNTAIVKDQVAQNDKLQLQKVNAELRNKMNQTSDLIRRLDAGIKTNHMEACNLGEAKRQLVKTRDELTVPLRITMKRLQLRDQRPHRELVEDPLHMALEIERNDLTNLTHQLNQMVDGSTDMLHRLGLMRSRLAEDKANKNHANNLDSLCLNLTHKQAPQYPPKQETLHIKASVAFGDIPPSMPTSVLLGENAGGRFNYEWLFKREEVQRLRAAFDKAAELGTILSADMEAVLLESGVLQPGQMDNFLSLASIHPDNRVNWELLLQSAASVRNSDEEVVTLPSHWRSKTAHDLDTNHALLMAAGRVRYQACELAAYASETKRKDHLFTQKQLRKKIQETSELRSLCERRIVEANLEIRRLEESERGLCREFECKAKPLALSESRYNIRRRRKGPEEVHDQVEDSLQEEVAELQHGVAAIQRELDLTRHTLDVMKENRNNLEEDYADKSYSLELHQRCLRLDTEKSSSARKPARNAFLAGEV